MTPEQSQEVRVFYVETRADPRLTKEDPPGYREALRRQAGRALVDTVFDAGAVVTEVTKPDDEYDPSARVVTRYAVALVMPTEGRNAFAEQLEAARREGWEEGIREAVAEVQKSASVYSEIGEGLIAFNVRSVADTVAKLLKTGPLDSRSTTQH